LSFGVKRRARCYPTVIARSPEITFRVDRADRTTPLTRFTAEYLFRQLHEDQIHALGAYHSDTLATREDIAYWSHRSRR
jgi:hypothetical protein